jgi:RNA polymerase sigma factor (sigma-70 family)
MDSTPASLIEQLRQRPTGAEWAQFVNLYSPVLLGWTRRLGIPEADRADLIQDTFVSLLRALPASRYDPSRRFRNWLYAILANHWKDRLRLKSPGPLAVDVPVPTDDTDEIEYRTVLLRRALELIRTECSERDWQSFASTALDGRPIAAIAAELGVTPNVVYLARSRILRRLRTVLGELLD